jgi:hypothetical protein
MLAQSLVGSLELLVIIGRLIFIGKLILLSSFSDSRRNLRESDLNSLLNSGQELEFLLSGSGGRLILNLDSLA